MAENFSQIPPNSTGEKIRLFKNTVGLNDVSSEATTITDQTGQVMKNMGVNGRVFVDGSEVTQPVSGTFWQTTQPVSGTVTANAGTGPWPVTDNAGSLTVDAPVGTPVFVRLSDGTAAITTLPVSGPLTDTQLRATPVPVSGTVGLTNDPTKLEDAAAASGDRGTFTLGVRNDASAVVTSADGDYSQVSVDSAGRQKVIVEGSLPAGTNGIGKLTANDGIDIGDVTINNAAGAAAVNIQDGGNSITVDGSVSIVTSMVPGTAATNLGKAEDAVAANGDTGVAMLGVRNDAAASKTSADGDYSMFATDSAGRIGIADLGGSVSIDDNAGSLTVDAPVGTPVFVRLSDGTAAISTLPVSGPLTDTQLRATAVPVSGTVAATQSGTWTVQPGNTANTTPWLTTNTPGTSGGYTISKLISAATTNATSVKASAGQLYGYYIYNDANATRYVKLHNTAGTPTAGTGVVMVVAIPAGSGANVEFANGIAFSTGIAFTTVTGIADANATAVGASDLAINLFYT